MSKFRFLLLVLSRRLWVHAVAFAVLALAAVVLAAFAGPRVAVGPGLARGAESVESILAIVASSMLAVATFSLGALISAFSTVQATASPRAAALLIEDRSAQTALSGFVGAFVFAVVALVALSTGIYGPGARVVLFIETALVLAAVVVAMVQWIGEASRLGLMSETIGRVERATLESLRTAQRRPRLGGTPAEAAGPSQPLASNVVGYVQHVDVARLEDVAERLDVRLFLEITPGEFADGFRPLARVEGLTAPLPAAEAVRLASAFVVGETRTFDQDPAYGLVLLREIACKALSPALNDTGTAIAVIGAAVRVLRAWGDGDPVPEDGARVRAAVAAPAELFDDVFTPVARDAAGMVEVGCRLQAAFISLASLPTPGFAEAARTQSLLALQRARDAGIADVDLARLERAARPLLGEEASRTISRAQERRAAETLP